jgi:hypothetical protein
MLRKPILASEMPGIGCDFKHGLSDDAEKQIVE